MSSDRDGQLLAETAASAGSVTGRAEALLEILLRVIPFDCAWLALADPLAHRYHSLGSVALDRPVLQFLTGPLMARDIEVTGTDRARPPLGPSDLPYPAEELPTWAECLIPSGIHEGLGLALFAPGGQHVGFLTVLSGGRQPPSQAVRRRLGQLAPVLAHGIDPMRSLVTAARLVRGATAGAVLCADGGCQPLPGLPGDALLIPCSPLLTTARERIDDGQVYSSFFWPLGGRHAPEGHVRVTVLAAPEDGPPGVTAVTLLSPVTDRHGLTPRELEVLGLLVEGCSNQEIARALVVAPRTVAAHLEHVLAKLGTPTRTHAAVRAERDGLYVPAPPRRPPGVPLSATPPACRSGPRHRPIDRCPHARDGPSVESAAERHHPHDRRRTASPGAAMDYETFTRTTAQRAGLPEETAERIEHATLRTLADRISGGEAGDLAAQLPARLQDDLRPQREEAEAFGVEEFVRRIAERGDVGTDQARSGASAVLTTVREAVTPGEFDDVLSQLPQEYRELVGPMA